MIMIPLQDRYEEIKTQKHQSEDDDKIGETIG